MFKFLTRKGGKGANHNRPPGRLCLRSEVDHTAITAWKARNYRFTESFEIGIAARDSRKIRLGACQERVTVKKGP